MSAHRLPDELGDLREVVPVSRMSHACLGPCGESLEVVVCEVCRGLVVSCACQPVTRCKECRGGSR